MKRFLSALLCLALLSACTACGGPTVVPDPAALAQALAEADLYSTTLYPIEPDMIAQVYAVTTGFTAAYGHAAAGDTADEFLVITAADDAGAKVILDQLEQHMRDFSALCAGYNPGQCPRIEGGLLMRIGCTVVWVVSNDTDAARAIVAQYAR